MVWLFTERGPFCTEKGKGSSREMTEQQITHLKPIWHINGANLVILPEHNASEQSRHSRYNRPCCDLHQSLLDNASINWVSQYTRAWAGYPVTGVSISHPANFGWIACYMINLSYDGGGAIYVPPHSSFIFLLKISPPDQTLRPTCKFLTLGILYHDFFSLKI